MEEEYESKYLQYGFSQNKHTKEELKEMQSWDLDRKIQVSQARIMEWFDKLDGGCHVSFSGGKDSCVLAYLTAQVCKITGFDLTLWFSDTGLEYPEIKQHVKFYADWLKEQFPDLRVHLFMDYPKDRHGKRIIFKDVLLKFGYPIISKEVASAVERARNAIKRGDYENSAIKRLNGEIEDLNNGGKSHYNYEKWGFLLDADFKISDYCCTVMKKRPSHKFCEFYESAPLVGTMACESLLRANQWIEHGCNSFDTKNPISKPLSFWTEQDILEFIVEYNVPIASVYGSVVKNNKGQWITTGCNRTGCMYCGFGCHLDKEPNRFQMLKELHPEIWEYCMKPVEDGGLGMKHVLDYIGVKTE